MKGDGKKVEDMAKALFTLYGEKNYTKGGGRIMKFKIINMKKEWNDSPKINNFRGFYFFYF